jgi:hypothetical protein
MTTKEKIEKAIAEIRDFTGNVYKGFDVATQREGWHWVPFNHVAIYLGRNEAEALETVEYMAEY